MPKVVQLVKGTRKIESSFLNLVLFPAHSVHLPLFIDFLEEVRLEVGAKSSKVSVLAE